MDMPANFIENRTYDEIQVGDSATLTRTLRPDDIQLFVRGNKVVGKQIRRDMRIRKQLIVTQAFRHDC